MAWRIAGYYVATCHCMVICPCPIDGTPTGPGGECKGTTIFEVREGNLDDVDLSGLRFAWMYHAPTNFSAGNLKMGLVVDEGASDEQAEAINRIFSGDAGGPFEQFKPLITEFAPFERAPVTISDGDNPTASIGGQEVRLELAKGADGQHTLIKNSVQGWRAEGYVPGKGSGHLSAQGIEYDSSYGEYSEYELAG
jgi:hypothetical protein